MRFLKRFGVRAWILGGAGILFIGGISVYAVNRSKGPETVFVRRHDVIEEVHVTGTLKAPATIELEFISSGRVVSRPVKVGETVRRGGLLMALDARASEIQIEKAAADLEANQARLEALKVGATPETITELRNNVTAAYRSALAALDAAITKAEQARTTLRADVFLDTNKVRPELNLALDAATAHAESDKAASDDHLAKLRALRSAVSDDFLNTTQLDQLFLTAPSELDYTRRSLSSSADILRRTTSPSISQATISTYLSDIATVQAGFDTAVKALVDGVSDIQAATDALRVKQAPPQEASLKEFEAHVKAARASLALLEKDRSDMFLAAPVDGVVTDLKYEVGEIARPNSVAVSMIATGAMEIEANIPEIDIAKTALGQPVSVTIDALPGEIFSGSVVHINPAETVIDGVTNFKVRAALTTSDFRIKSGLTANLVIETGKKENVLVIPFSAIIERDGKTFVSKEEGKNAVDVPVTLGIRGADGTTEIILGLSEGDVILTTPQQ